VNLCKTNPGKEKQEVEEIRSGELPLSMLRNQDKESGKREITRRFNDYRM
jgi:hypothetical protein